MMWTGGQTKPSRSARSARSSGRHELLCKGRWVKVANRIERECDRIANDLCRLKVLP
jgi:hypothetical protein